MTKKITKGSGSVFKDLEREHLARLLKPRKGFMDMTDYESELGRASDGNKVYPSVKACLKENLCVKECGIVEVEVRFVKIVRKPMPHLRRKNGSILAVSADHVFRDMPEWKRIRKMTPRQLAAAKKKRKKR